MKRARDTTGNTYVGSDRGLSSCIVLSERIMVDGLAESKAKALLTTNHPIIAGGRWLLIKGRGAKDVCEYR